MKHRSLWVMVLLLASGCGEVIDGVVNEDEVVGSDDAPLQISPAASEMVPVLGTGWDIAAEQFRIDCVSSETIQIPPDSRSRINVRATMTSDQVKQDLGMSLSVKGRYGVFSGSMKGSLVAATTQNAMSRVWVYSVEVTDRIDKLNPEHMKLNLAGRSAVKRKSWQQICGDEVVHQVQRGGLFYLVYRLDFDSEESRRAVEAKINASSIGAMEASAALSSLQSMLANHSTLTVEAYQFGGDPKRLASIVSGMGADTESSEDAVRTLIDCTNMNLGACDTFVRRAINYASNQDDPRAFPQQVPNNPAARMYVTAPWSSFDLGDTPRQLNNDVLENSRGVLADAFDSAVAYKSRLDAIASGRWSTTEQVNMAIEKRAAVNKFLGELGSAILKCYDRLRPSASLAGEYEGAEACQQAALDIDTKKAPFLAIPPALQKHPFDRAMLDQWNQLKGMTGPDPTVNQIQVGDARCGTTGDTAICVYAGALGIAAHTMTVGALTRWKHPEMLQAIGYPIDDAHTVLRTFGGTAIATTFERGILVTSETGVTTKENREDFEAKQELIRRHAGR